MHKLSLKRNTWRYVIMMTLGVVMNIVFHEIASALNLPMWLDYTGTALCAIVLEPTAGLLVGLTNNFFLAIESHSPDLIIYYAVSAAIALIVGLGMRKNQRLCLKRIPLVMVLLVLVCATLSTALTFWRANGISNHFWENYYCSGLAQMGLPYWLSLFGGIALVKVFDATVTVMIDLLIYFALPKWLKHEAVQEAA